MPSVYYWRTTLTLDSTERAFLADHGVGRMYVRYFDVVMREDPNQQEPSHAREIWTFIRQHNTGNWQLDGLQQVD